MKAFDKVTGCNEIKTELLDNERIRLWLIKE